METRDKKDGHPSSRLAMISMFCGMACIPILLASVMLLLIFAGIYPVYPWIEGLINVFNYIFPFFLTMGVVFGVYSLFIQRNTRAWVAIIVGLLSIVVFLFFRHWMSFVPH